MVACSPSALTHDRPSLYEGVFFDMAQHQDQLNMFGAEPTPSRRPLTTLPRVSAETLSRIADPLDLNPQQLQAVTAKLGPSLVLAGAGTGKTKVLTRRAGWLIAQGLHPKHILLITFTRKAAAEMLRRVQEVNPFPSFKIQGGTFHSMANQWLRHHGSAIGLTPRFALMDENDASSMLHLLASKQRLHTVKGFPDKRTLLMLFSQASNSLSPVIGTIEQDFPQHSAHTTAIAALHRLFVDTKWTQQRFDYDDLLLLMHRLFTEQPEAAARLSSQYHALLVDEYQDTTRLQAELVRGLAAPHQNVMVVGDEFQCLKKGTPVLTPNGYKSVETLKEGDAVIAATGCAKTSVCKITKTFTSWPDSHIRITTKRGHTVEVSPNHICFAKSHALPPGWFLYLMHRADFGYRIGITSVTKQHRNSMLRTQLEQADKFWYLQRYDTRTEAQYHEALYSLRYQIPQVLFTPEGRAVSRMTNEHAKTFFDEFGKNGYRLLKDFGLDFDKPAYAPKASRSRNRIAINVIQCNSKAECHNSAKPKHLLVVESKLATELAHFFPNGHVKNGYWRLRVQSQDYEHLLNIAKDIQWKLNRSGYHAVVIEKANFLNSATRKTSLFLPMPAAGLVVGMTVPVEQDGRIETDTITSLERIPNIEQVPSYDLEVEHAHNIITNSLVTHNSIYSFRAADVRNMQDFLHLFEQPTVYKLEQNYRSTKAIIQVANRLIAQGSLIHHKTLFTTKSAGPRPQLVECPDEHVQSAYVIDQIRALQQQGLGLHRIAVLVRLSAYSYDLETALTHHRLPFVKYGGLALVETAHVKDFIAYLTVVTRPHDRLAWQRLLLLVDRIGPAAAEDLIGLMKQRSQPLTVLEEHIGAGADDLRTLAVLLRNMTFDDVPLGLRLQQLLDHYQPYLKRHYPDDVTERMNELAYLVQCHKDVTSLTQLIEGLTETGTSDHTQTPDHPADTLILSTIHSAKGLEWDAVFVINVMDGRIPHSRACSNPATLEEERRLLYVAVTRARHVLFLTYPVHTLAGHSHFQGKCSRFLEPLTAEDVDRIVLQ